MFSNSASFAAFLFFINKMMAKAIVRMINPPKMQITTIDSAGRLLDKAGVKNFNLERVKVWDRHANFIVNKGGATSEDVLELMVKMFNAVKNMYTIELTPEIIFIGDKTEKEEELCDILYKKVTR